MGGDRLFGDEDSVQEASSNDIEEGYRPGEGRWPKNWRKVMIPTAHKYLEALLLLWVRFKDTEKEMFWFFRVWDMAWTSGYHVFNRMERHCRHLAISMNDHGNLEEKYPKYSTRPELRDILIQAEKLLHYRAAGPLYHDPRGRKYAKTRLMPPRCPNANPGYGMEDDRLKPFPYLKDDRLKPFPYLEDDWRNAKPFLEEDQRKLYESMYDRKPDL